MESYDNRPIGVFDSGLGGLTAVTYMADLLPDENFVYFGDTARTPYGSKSIETIQRFSAQISDFLAENGAKIIVIACNTVSATCLELLRARHPGIPVVGMIMPAAEYMVRECAADSKVGVIGTKVTIESSQYEKAIRKCGGKFDVKSKACPLFVPVIEEGINDDAVIKSIIRYYLDDFLRENDIDTLVLGCTHYPMLEKVIREMYSQLTIINPSMIVAQEVKKYLWRHNMLALENQNRSAFYASDLSGEFLRIINNITGNKEITIHCKNFNEK